MAIRRLIKTKTKKPVLSKAVAQIANQKYVGSEPKPSEFSSIAMMETLNWYHIMMENSDAKRFTIDYLRNRNKEKEANRFEKVPENRVNLTSSWMIRMIENGWSLSKNNKEFIERKIRESLDYSEVTLGENKKTNRAQAIKSKIGSIIADLDQAIDKGGSFVEEFFKNNQISPIYHNAIIEYYRPCIEEMMESMTKQDSQLIESYSHMSKEEIEDKVLLLNEIIENCEEMGKNVNKRKPRAKKIKTPDEILKNFTFMERDLDLELTSINPKKILGAQEVWLFNVKDKRISVLRGNLNVIQSSIIGFDEQKSLSKKCGKNTKEILSSVINIGKVGLRKIMDDIKCGASKPQYRCNENTIILRAL